MSCDPNAVISSQALSDLNKDIKTIDEVVESKLDTTTTKDGKVINTLDGQLKLLGYQTPVVYASAIGFTSNDNMATIDRNGTIYAPKPSAIPFTTSGTWTADDEDKFFVVQGLTTTSDEIVLAADTVADMKTKDLQPGQTITTKGYYTKGDGGGAKYLIQTAAEFGGVPDGFGDHTLDNGNIAALQADGLVNISTYGARDDGTSDSSTNFNAALAKSSIYIPSTINGFFVGSVIVGTGKSIVGCGRNSVLICSITNGAMIALNNYASIKNVRLTATQGKDSGFTDQVGIFIDNQSRTIVSNVWLDGFGGAGYRVTNIVNNHEGNTLNNYTIESCNVGFEAATRGEYQQVGQGNITLCNTGMRIQGGNYNAVGAVVSDNDIGIHLVQGSNDAHGQLIGIMLNHNGYTADNTRRTILVDAPDNGFLFSGCQIFNGSPIELKGCHNVWFRNCVKQAVNIIEDGCVQCGFANSDLLDGINNQPNTNNDSEVFYLDNALPVGSATTGANGFGGGFLRLEQLANIKNIPTGDTDLDWDTVVNNSITGNLNYTIQQFYGDGGAGTGNPFVRGDTKFVRMQGSLEVQAQLTIGKADAPAWNADEVTIKLLNTVGEVVGYFTPATQASQGASNLINYSFHGTVPRDAFKCVIENNSGGTITLIRHQIGTEALSFMVVQGW